METEQQETVRPQGQPQTPARVRYRSMDGIKGLALIGIIWYHLSPLSLHGGFVGVDMFFTVSGFLLGLSLLRECVTRGAVDVKRFYLRRIVRLWPAMVFMVTATVSLDYLFDRDALVGVAGKSIAAVTFTSNWYEIFTGGSYFASTSPQPLRHLWFVALLAQVTIVLPWLVMLVRKTVPERFRIAVPLGLAAVSALLMWVLYRPDVDPTRVYFGTDTHCFGIMLGLALAWLVTESQRHEWPIPDLARQVAPWLATVALVWLIVLMMRVDQDASAFRGGLLTAAVLSVVLLAGSITSGSWMENLFVWRPLALLGRYSYGIYLWHWPLFLMYQSLLPGWRGRGMWLIRLLALVSAGLMTAVSWWLVERPLALLIDPSKKTDGDSRKLFGADPSVMRIVVAVPLTIALVVGCVFGYRNAPAKSSVQQMLEANQSVLDQQAHKRASDAKAAAEAKRRAAEEAKRRAQAQAEAEKTLKGDQITVVGDSVTVGSSPALNDLLPGIVIDAKVSRFVRDAPGIVSNLKAQGQLRKYVVVSLNTNGNVTTQDYEDIAAAAGDGHVLVIVNGYGDRTWIPTANQAAVDYVRAHPATATIADWNSAIGAHTDMLTSDGIHPEPEGQKLYAQTVKDAIVGWIADHAD
ncbi:acyltransferase family protein [Bifidobacterium biavatii]|uniref:acyltransferase family protein n=1 Tax=Bifidobacterium biavatii TaxID=762212 RepID=UPI0009DDC738|nr:acyltransferase family protein [Bifidobacterium biavatii]